MEQNETRWRIGTSGFSYKEWVGDFYPPKTPGTKMLSFYAAHFLTVEVNYTFRAMPKPQMLEGWAAQTPETFRFALKAPQRITHFMRLRGAADIAGHFAKTASVLGERLGPVLFQLPPNFKADIPLLSEFLDELDSSLKPAFEFRDKSWFSDNLFETLRQKNTALCIAETEDLATPVERTASHVYLRLRKGDYNDAELTEWARRIAKFADDGAQTFVYFKHELSAPKLAERLGQILDESVSA